MRVKSILIQTKVEKIALVSFLFCLRRFQLTIIDVVIVTSLFAILWFRVSPELKFFCRHDFISES